MTVAMRVQLPSRAGALGARLFLEERDAVGVLQDGPELVRVPVRGGGEHDGVPALAPAQVGVDHVPLDRPGPHDRDLDHEVVELLGLQAGQHRHLRPALDLENADGIRPREHGVDLRPLGRDVGERRVVDAVGAAQEIQAATQAGQHAEAQHVDLHQAEDVDVVLVPLDEGAVRHRRVADRHGLVEAVAREHEAADVLGEVAREADERGREVEGLPDRGVLRVEPGLGHVPVGEPVAPRAPDRVGHQRGDVGGEPEHLADLADGRARSVVDHRGAERGPLPAVARVEVLDHLLAPLVLEVDVDVGRLAAAVGEEAGEEEPVLGRVDRRDAEAEAHRRVRRRAPALAQDAPVGANWTTSWTVRK